MARELFRLSISFYLIFGFLLFHLNTPDAHAIVVKNPSKKASIPKLLPAERANAELSKVQSKPSKKTALTQGTQGIFTYIEPELQFAQRPFEYTVGVRLQHLKPKGIVHSDIVGDFDLTRYQGHWFPIVEFGISKNHPNIWNWQTWTLLAQLGYSSYAERIQFSSGFLAPLDTRINTLRANLFWKAECLWPDYSPIKYSYGLSLGKLYYAQTSSNDLAQFAENLYFLGMHGGVIYPVNQFTEASIDYVYRRSVQASSIDIEPHNFEFGMKLKW